MPTDNKYDLHYRLFFKEICRGITFAVPVLIGFLPFGLLLGTQAAQKNLSPLDIGLLTGLNFAGGSEFAVVALWSPIPPVLMIVFVSALVNSRYLIMGLAFAPLINHLPPKKALPVLFAMCDESWALSMADAAQRRAAGLVPFSSGFYIGLAGSMWFTWISSTILGVIIGPGLGDITRWGFDMAFPAVFFVLLKGMWKGCRAAIPWLVSLICAITAYHFIPGAVYVPVGIISGLAVILLMEEK